MLESIGGGGDAGLGDAALVDSVYGLNALRAMFDAARLARRASDRALGEAAAASAAAAAGTAGAGARAGAGGDPAAEAVKALLPATVELGAIAAGVATALEHLPASLRETDRCIALLLEAAADPLASSSSSSSSSGETRIAAARMLLEVTVEALESMDLGEIGTDTSLPGLAGPQRPGVTKAKLKAAAATGVKKFLNRLLAKTIEVQVVIFAFFMACLEAKIAMAKVRRDVFFFFFFFFLRERERAGVEDARAVELFLSLSVLFAFLTKHSLPFQKQKQQQQHQQRAGTFDSGVSTLTGSLVPESESSFGAVVPAASSSSAAMTTNAAAANAAAAASPDALVRLLWRERQPPHRELRFAELRIDRGVSFEEATVRLRAQLPKPHPRARTGFFVSRRRIFGPHFAVVLALVRGYSAPVGAAAPSSTSTASIRWQ